MTEGFSLGKEFKAQRNSVLNVRYNGETELSLLFRKIADYRKVPKLTTPRKKR